jgi:two-component system, NarL family, nitrate/nitrite response regulator NarL
VSDRDDAMLVVEDDPAVAEAIARVVAMRVRAQTASRGDAAFALVSDVTTGWLGAIVDVGLPDGDGIELTKRLRAVRPNLPVLVLTGRDERRLANDAVRAGAQFAFKPLGADEINAFIATAIAAHPDSRLDQALGEYALAKKLTSRETEILRMAVLGLPRVAIRNRFGITENTLKTQVRTMKARTGEASLDHVVRAVFELALGWG